MNRREPNPIRSALLAMAIGIGIAALLFFGWSA